MGEVIHKERFFQEKLMLNRIIAEGRAIVKLAKPGWRQRLRKWKNDNRALLQYHKFDQGPPYGNH